MTGRQGRRREKLLDDLKDRRGYFELKEEPLDRNMWRNRFARCFGPVVWQITDDDDDIYLYIYIYLNIITARTPLVRTRWTTSHCETFLLLTWEAKLSDRQRICASQIITTVCGVTGMCQHFGESYCRDVSWYLSHVINYRSRKNNFRYSPTSSVGRV